MASTKTEGSNENCENHKNKRKNGGSENKSKIIGRRKFEKNMQVRIHGENRGHHRSSVDIDKFILKKVRYLIFVFERFVRRLNVQKHTLTNG